MRLTLRKDPRWMFLVVEDRRYAEMFGKPKRRRFHLAWSRRCWQTRGSCVGMTVAPLRSLHGEAGNPNYRIVDRASSRLVRRAKNRNRATCESQHRRHWSGSSGRQLLYEEATGIRIDLARDANAHRLLGDGRCRTTAVEMPMNSQSITGTRPTHLTAEQIRADVSLRE
jgi:hypothetical protein